MQHPPHCGALMRTPVLPLLALLALLTACAHQAPKAHPSTADASLWDYAVDSFGSKAQVDRLLHQGVVRIAFEQVPSQPPDRHSWVELIHRPALEHLGGVTGLRLQYQCSSPLTVKFAQSDYSVQGDNSFAHYQASLPASAGWSTATLSLKDFARPTWTPASSLDKGLILEHVKAVYLVPALGGDGGKAELAVRELQLLR